MKKLFFIAAAMVMAFTSCGNKTATVEESQDSIKSFEQNQIEASIKLQLDSLAAEAGRLQGVPGIQNDIIQLTEEQKMVKPDYLIDPASVAELQLLSEKYRALAILLIDKKVAQSYDMPIEDYDKAISQLMADINDPALGLLTEGATIEENLNKLYEAEEAAGRINLFWELVTASSIEQIYLLAQNTDLYIGAISDEAAENMTFRIILLTDAMDRLTEYDSEILELNEAIQPLKVLDALTADELKKQLEELGEDITAVRASLLQ